MYKECENEEVNNRNWNAYAWMYDISVDIQWSGESFGNFAALDARADGTYPLPLNEENSMKNVITGTACMILLFAVMLQFIHVQTMVHDMHEVMNATEVFREQLRLDGCLRDENVRNLKKQIVSQSKIKTGEIQVRGSRRPVQRGGRIHYRIRVPLGRSVLAYTFFGVGKTQVWYREDRYAASEYMASDKGSERNE
jgi:hypothetical protein